MGVFASFQLLAGLMYPDTERVRRRLSQEFDPKGQRPATSPLFPTLPEMTLDAPSLEEVASNQPRPRKTTAAYIADLLTQARVPCTPGQLVLIACILALAVGAVALGFGGPVLALPAAILAACAPPTFIYVRVR